MDIVNIVACVDALVEQEDVDDFPCFLWCGVFWCGVLWRGALWHGVVCCDVVCYGLVFSGVMWCGVVCYSVAVSYTHLTLPTILRV